MRTLGAGRPARVGVTRASGQPLAAASLAGVGRGIDERKGIGTARVEWNENDQAEQAARGRRAGPLLGASPRVRHGHGPGRRLGVAWT